MDYSNLREKVSTPVWNESQERSISSSYCDLETQSNYGAPFDRAQRLPQTLLEPYTYYSAIPGKEIRSKLIDAFNAWLCVEEGELEVIRKVVRMLHNASLLMDDVEDNSELRRGVPVAHMVYGVPQTINTANYVYFLAMQMLMGLRSPSPTPTGEKGKGKEEDVLKMVTEELLNLHRGQGLDLFWRDSLTCPTEEEYVHMVLGKTGGLFRIAVKLMMARSAASTDYVPLVNLISVFFQIRDDYMNLQSHEYEDNKGYCEDLTEGKFSFPIVHGVRADPQNRQILNVLQKRTSSVPLKRHTVEYLDHHTQSFAYTRKVLKELHGQIEEEVASLGGNPALEKILGMLGLPAEPPTPSEQGTEQSA